MLRFLKVRHFAVIDEVELEFGPGLNVLTGETGAGKSILVEAVGLLLGGRASPDLVRTGEESAVVEAIFETGDAELLIRREVTLQGRSRALINGELATAGALKERTARLIELHGQHQHHVLLDPDEHLKVLDACGRLDPQIEPVAAAFDRWKESGRQLAECRRLARDRAERQELLAFQLSDFDRAAPKKGEDDELAATRQILASAERVERLCSESYGSLYESDLAVLSQLGGVWRRVGELAALDARFQPYIDAREAIKSQLEDLALFLRRYAEGVDASPGRLQQVEERLALLERLKRKYGPTLDEVIARREAVRAQLADLEQSTERSAELERLHAEQREAFQRTAADLSAARRRAAAELVPALERTLAELAMDRTAFEVRFDEAPLPDSEWTAAGLDRVEFFVSPNPGEDLRPLARIVSGGELSRIMLAIKTLTAAGRFGLSDADDRAPGGAAPGMIFDEVDAGIGGRAADVVGRKLRALGSAFQVLCITHLPQIAAYADAHFSIEKHVHRGRTETLVRRLDDEGRVGELARMLGGEGVTEGLRASAREMLTGRRETGTRPQNPPSSGSQQAKGESISKGESETIARSSRTERTQTAERDAKKETSDPGGRRRPGSSR